MMNELESKLEKLTRLTKAFEQADDSNKRSHLANELLCTLENTTLSARRYFSSFLKPEKHGREAHILPHHVEEHCAVEVTRDGWTHIRLNTLLQSNRQRVTGYIESTLLQMLRDHRAAGSRGMTAPLLSSPNTPTAGTRAAHLIPTTRNGSA